MRSTNSIDRLLADIGDDSFADRVDIIGEAGRGGMGIVFEAKAKDGTRLAVKKLSGSDEVDVDRFVAEADVLESLEHPVIVRYVEHGATTLGEHYLVMGWLEGESLRQRIDRRGPLTVTEVIGLAERLASGLAYVHERGVVHRDLKPSNIILEDGDASRPVIVDFGIAKREQAPESLTKTGQVVGTPGYLAPEQVKGEGAIDGRADLFALGCVIYECLSGNPAFTGDTVMATLAAVLLEVPPKIEMPLPRQLAELLLELIEKDASDRPASAIEVAQRLAKIDAEGDHIVTDFDAAKRPTVAIRRRPSSKLRWPIIAAAVGLGLAGIVALVASRGAPERPPCDRDQRQGCLLRCEAGDRVACYRQGQGLAHGLGGIRRDRAEAIGFLSRSCDAGYGRACKEAATLLTILEGPGDLGGRYEALLVKGCDAGFAGACRRLARDLSSGDRLAVDRPRARRMARRGCELGDNFACDLWADYLGRGIGGAVDADRASEIRRASCERGHQPACAH